MPARCVFSTAAKACWRLNAARLHHLILSKTMIAAQVQGVFRLTWRRVERQGISFVNSMQRTQKIACNLIVLQVRDFMLAKISKLKQPRTNIQILQQTSLLRYKYFVRFLWQHGREAYDGFRTEYVNILSRILASHFRTYLQAMKEIQTVRLAVSGRELGVI